MEKLIITDNNIRYEIYPHDLGYGNGTIDGIMSWHYAMESCKRLGDGWRLPTKDELYLLYKKKENLGILPLHGYWSSSEVDKDHAHYQYFFTGVQYVFDKSFPSFARPIRILI